MPNDARALIENRYHIAYAAQPDISFSEFGTRHVGEKLAAALGYRRADREPLFLEAYIDEPIETALASAIGRPFARHDIIEIGNLASDNAMAMIDLWADTANDLGGSAEIAVAVLTAPLRSMFRRLGLRLHEIAAARPERLGASAQQWGSYYQLDPVICAGFISEGQDRLARIVRHRNRAA